MFAQGAVMNTPCLLQVNFDITITQNKPNQRVKKRGLLGIYARSVGMTIKPILKMRLGTVMLHG